MTQIGYFYLYKRCLLGEIHNPDTSSVYEGHYQFWTNEAPKVFCTPDIHTVLLASYGCDRGRITYQDKRYIFLGTPGIIKNRDKIFKYFGFNEQNSIILISDDDHYKITWDKETLKDYSSDFKVPRGYKYLIGRI